MARYGALSHTGRSALAAKIVYDPDTTNDDP